MQWVNGDRTRVQSFIPPLPHDKTKFDAAFRFYHDHGSRMLQYGGIVSTEECLHAPRGLQIKLHSASTGGYISQDHGLEP